jgi:hypothetical protein
MYGGGGAVQVQLQVFFTVALDGGEWSALYSGRSNLCAKKMDSSPGLFLLEDKNRNFAGDRILLYSLHWLNYILLYSAVMYFIIHYLFVAFLRVSLAVALKTQIHGVLASNVSRLSRPIENAWQWGGEGFVVFQTNSVFSVLFTLLSCFFFLVLYVLLFLRRFCSVLYLLFILSPCIR